ncbi:hypothetical protein [Nitrosomonas sp.]|uniref:hypothetical protein n=1 Tax=Nitrosomonas sp. TaxID=42353 RepID=UPI00262925D4|nr:hypothetical protein [Nitrosomonas sp.]MCW5600152.1 hypothetical protein [Nitrosomonas sp.]
MSENYLENFKLAVSRHEELKNQKAIAEETVRDCDSKIGFLELEISQAKRNLAADEKRNFRGDLSDESLAKSKLVIEKLIDELEQFEKRKKIAQSVIPDIDRESIQIGQAINSARFHYCQDIRSGITESLSGDKSLQKKLLNAYAAMVSGGNFNGDWRSFLAGIFREPGQPEIIEAADAFRKAHGLEEG